MSRPSRLTFHLIPHTHWDREWYLSRAAFQARLIPVLDGVLDQLERDPAARFLLDGQTILVEDYLAVRPEHEGRLRAQVTRGTLEVGPWYVLSDLLIPSLHSLRKNLEEGARQAGRLGRRLEVLYSPDAFGHPAVLPRIAAEFGLRWAVVRRGLGKPGDFYRWEAPSGESVLVHHLPRSGYDAGMALLSPGDFARHWSPLRRELVERAATDQIAVFLGADHHAMATNVSELRARLASLEPSHEVRISGLGEFFAAVDRNPPTVPAVRGELRSGGGHAWVLQGVHSTRSRLKRNHAAQELLLSRIAEPLAPPGHEGVIAHAWRTLLQCQFHDTIAGTTADSAQREQSVRLEAVGAICREIAEAGIRSIAGYGPDSAPGRPEPTGPTLAVWNPSRRTRSGIVITPLTFFRSDVLVGPPGAAGGGGRARLGPGFRPVALQFPSGEAPVQVLRQEVSQARHDSADHYPDQDEVDRVWVAFRTPTVPGLGAVVGHSHPSRRVPADGGLRIEPGLLANRLVSAGISPTGVLTVTDLASGTVFPGLLALVDEPDQGDLYTFSRGTAPPQTGGTPISQAVFATGPLVAATETRWRMRGARGGSIEARLVAALFADSSLIRLRLDLENCALDHRLRARFPVERGRALVGLMDGTESRDPVDGRGGRDSDWFEQVAPTAPAHRFAVAGGGTGDHRKRLGVFAPGFFECEWSRKGELFVTLLRSTGELSRGDLPERPGHAAWPLSTPEAQEPGKHIIELGVAPLISHDAEAPERLEEIWEDLFLPCSCYRLSAIS